MMRLVTFVAATAFLVPLGAAMFLIAGTANLPSVWLRLARQSLRCACSSPPRAC